MSNKIRAVLFDMDGVLIDAKEWHYEALNLALNQFGYNISPAEHAEIYDGLPTREKLRILSREKGLPERYYQDISSLKQRYTERLIEERCRPVKDEIEVLGYLRNNGYLMAVCSNSVRASIKKMLTLAKIISYFSVILSNEDVKNSKPNPEIYLTAMEKLGVTSASCLILEDNKNGIEAAVRSGGHLLRINKVEDVNMDNICRRIKEIEGG